MRSSSPLSRARRRGSLHERVFAWVYAHSGGKRKETPAEDRRQVLLGDLRGDVLEIGPGIGPNLRYLSPDVRWLGVEPNPYMHVYLEQAIRALGLREENFRIDPGDPQGVRLPAPDESMDAVISTHVLCSVPQLEDSLGEILRVLRPGGRLVFLEHVAAPHDTRLRALQDLVQPVWTWVGLGCYPNRETGEMISHAGFARVEMERFEYPGAGPVAPHVTGIAVKGG